MQIVEVHEGVFPSDLDALLALPGVGPYTTRAVLVFAYERDVGVVEWDDPIAIERCIAGLVADGLVEIRGDAVVLAGG